MVNSIILLWNMWKNIRGDVKMYHATSIVRDTIVFMCSMGICVLLPSTYMMCGFLDMGKIRVVRKKGRENDRRRWAFVKKRKLFSFENKRKWHTSRISSKDMPEKRRVNEHLYCINCVSKILPKYGKNVRKSMLILLRSLKR